MYLINQNFIESELISRDYIVKGIYIRVMVILGLIFLTCVPKWKRVSYTSISSNMMISLFNFLDQKFEIFTEKKKSLESKEKNGATYDFRSLKVFILEVSIVNLE